jgi:carboxypeptidase T
MTYMTKGLFTALFYCLLPVLQAQNPTEPVYRRVLINLDGRSLETLSALGIETDHGEYRPGRSFISDFSDEELARVRAAGFQTTVLIDRVADWYAAQQPGSRPVTERGVNCKPNILPAHQYATPDNYEYGTMGGYHTLAEMEAILDQMAARFPNLITKRAMVSDTIKTHEGRPQWWVKISDNPNLDEAEPEVLYTALHHAREPNSLSQMLFFMWYLLENYQRDPEVRYIVQQAELYFIPCINPDGYEFNRQNRPGGGGMWRKNRRVNGGGTFGVDLNRNYGFKWGFNNAGSSPSPNVDTYRGPAAFSEHKFLLAHNYHTFGNLLLYPFGYNDQVADPDFKPLAQLYSRDNGYTIGTGIETVGYPVNGVSDDWMFGDRDILSFTPEIGPGFYGFWPPIDAIDRLNKEAMWMNMSTALTAIHYGEARDQSTPDLNFPEVDLPVTVRRYGFQSGRLRVELLPLTPNVTVATEAQTFDLKQFESKNTSFRVRLTPPLVPNAPVVLLLRTDNGFYVHTDTLRKTWKGAPRRLFYDDFGSARLWRGSWGSTTRYAASPTTSLTDSPGGDYLPNVNNVMDLLTPVSIPASALNPELRFLARWEVEEFTDFAQVAISTASNPDWKPLCGRYTSVGRSLAEPEQPVYIGTQPIWVQEIIDLSAYAGQNVRIRFRMKSDEFREQDGFYVDDVEVRWYDPNQTVATDEPTTPLPVLALQPIPADQTVQLQWSSGALYQKMTLRVCNALGTQVFEQSYSHQGETSVSLPTATWPAGVYACQAHWADGRVSSVKFVVIH